MANGKTPKSTVGPTPPRIDFVKPSSLSSFSVGDSEPSATEIQFGLWDHLVTSGGTVLTGADENNNFIGSDSRRFYIRVRDPSAKGRGTIEAEWWTAHTNSTDPSLRMDRANTKLNLFEVTASPGVFTSRALMLVNDDDDRRATPNSGIPSNHPTLGAQAGNRNDTQPNYRLRKCGMHNFVVASYTPKAGRAKAVSTTAPVFTSKKLLSVQVYVVRETKGGPPSVDPNDLFGKDLLAITKTYEKIGIWFWAALSTADRANPNVTKLTGPPSVNYDLCVVDPPAGMNPLAVNLADVTALGRAFPAEGPKFLRLFYVKGFNFSDVNILQHGRSFGITPDPNPRDNCAAFTSPPDSAGISVVQSNRGDVFTAAHELGHLLLDKSKVRRVQRLPPPNPPVCDDGSHFRSNDVDLRVAMNLINDLGPKNPTQKFLDPKRIWTEFDDDNVDHLGTIRASRFLG
jgi:hypothetical protein